MFNFSTFKVPETLSHVSINYAPNLGKKSRSEMRTTLLAEGCSNEMTAESRLSKQENEALTLIIILFKQFEILGGCIFNDAL